jgi:hypothetical protein
MIENCEKFAHGMQLPQECIVLDRTTIKIPHINRSEFLELPFEYVIVSHGDPVHTLAAYECALELTRWNG